MRKIRLILILMSAFLLSSGLYAKESAASGLQTGIFASFNQGFGSIEEHELGNASAGVDVFYRLAKFGSVVEFGLSATGDFGTAIGKKDYIDSWFVVDAAAGIWLGIKFTPSFSFRPEIDYGAAMNLVNSDERNIHGLNTDQLIRAGGTFIIEPAAMKGVAIYFGADYQLMPEKDNLGHFIGAKAGILYRPGKTGTIKASDEKQSE